MSDQLNIVKIGGNIINDGSALSQFLDAFAQIEGLKILVHGGGRKATELSGRLGHKVSLIEGRRITDADGIEVAIMVYAGLINKQIVAKLQARGANAIGLS